MLPSEEERDGEERKVSLSLSASCEWATLTNGKTTDGYILFFLLFCFSHKMHFSLSWLRCLKKTTTVQQSVRFKDQLQKKLANFEYSDAVKLIPGTAGFGKPIMDVSGAILLW